MQKLFSCFFLLACLFIGSIAWSQEEPLVDSPNPLLGSSLAPERPIRHDLNQAVEDVLKDIENQADHQSELNLLINFETVEGFPVNLNRDSLGLDSYKATLNWDPPPEGEKFNKTAQLVLFGKQNEFHLERIDSEKNPLEWWHIKEGYFYSSKILSSLPFITRWSCVEALESDMISYGEGLGLILWTSRPGDFLRRSQHLALGEKAIISGNSYITLISTPDWIKNPPTLPTRDYYPYNQSKLISWAELTPVITYYINPDYHVIEGAVFDYYKVLRSNQGRWTVIPKYSGHSVQAWVTEWTVSENMRFPKTIEGKYIVDEKIKRKIVFSVSKKDPSEMVQLELDAGRRLFESFPPYQSKVYKNRIIAGKNDYANRVGLVNALAFEGDLSTALVELKALIKDFQTDEIIIPESMGGIDWHLGYAVYEFLQRDGTSEYNAIWNDFDPIEPFASILARACDFYARWHRAEKASFVEDHFNMYKNKFGVKARLMHSIGRTLIKRVEKETVRGLEIEESLKEADNDELRLAALQGAVDAYISDKNFIKAWEVIDLAETLLQKPESIDQFNILKEKWETQINAIISERDQKEWEDEVQGKEDFCKELKARLLRAEKYRSKTEVGRLKKVIGKLENKIEELKQ